MEPKLTMAPSIVTELQVNDHQENHLHLFEPVFTLHAATGGNQQRNLHHGHYRVSHPSRPHHQFLHVNHNNNEIKTSSSAPSSPSKSYPSFVKIVEVGPRDGLQNEKVGHLIFNPETKIYPDPRDGIQMYLSNYVFFITGNHSHKCEA